MENCIVNSVVVLFCCSEFAKHVYSLGTQGAAFTIVNNDKELKMFSDFIIEGKLQTKLLRTKDDWPSNLIYNDEFFSSCEKFRVGIDYIFKKKNDSNSNT